MAEQNISDTVRANIKDIVNAYRKVTRSSLTTCSNKFYGNAYFFADFYRGDVSISLERLDKMLRQFRAEWPSGAEWPYCRAVLFNGPKK